jgi:hypothetical protein
MEEVASAASLATWRGISFLHILLFASPSKYVHAAFGGGGPRWQPLNVAGRHDPMERRQLESVLAGGMETAEQLAAGQRRCSAIGWGTPVVVVTGSSTFRRRWTEIMCFFYSCLVFGLHYFYIRPFSYWFN